QRYHRGPGARGRTTAGRQGKREEQDCFVHRFLRSKGTSGRDDDLAGHLLVAAAAEDGAVEIVGPALSGKIRTCVTLPGSTVSSILRSGTWKPCLRSRVVSSSTTGTPPFSSMTRR